ncbi:NAD(P)-dependent oxidoreductase [Clostridium sp. BSD9I1]|uniref:NAD(P)-dependent oxidoreductase n=1 Tax=Clostridium sp. BSD9I1 TaxID=2003589 RepID=UPI001645F116|nr:NAD(P)-dependent oxidoreductase [Clostridium sp. BSD9I1]
MLEANRENILPDGINDMFLSIVSCKINVLIVGGGRAGFIKAKTLTERGCNVTVVSPELSSDFKTLKEYNNIKFIKDTYKREYIRDKHLIVIAVPEEFAIEVKKHCEEEFKLYIASYSFREGIAVLPYQRSTKSMSFALKSMKASPKTTRFIGQKLEKTLTEYDDFMEYSCRLREKLKRYENREEILNFISSDDFYFSYTKNKQDLILKMFFGDDFNEYNSSY